MLKVIRSFLKARLFGFIDRNSHQSLKSAQHLQGGKIIQLFEDTAYILRLLSQQNEEIRTLRGITKTQSEFIKNLKRSTGEREKVHVLFVLQSLDLWLQWDTLVDFLKSEKSDFIVRVLIIPTIQPGQREGQTYCWRSVNFAKGLGIDFQILEYEGDKIHPWFQWGNYTFFQTPYETQRPKMASAAVASHFSHVCYIPYAYTIVSLPELQYKNAFLEHCEYYFFETVWQLEDCARYNPSILGKGYVTGYPKLTKLNDTVLPSRPTLLWNPRWKLDDPVCTIKWAATVLLIYMKQNSSHSLIFRPHPLLMAELDRPVHEDLRQIIKELLAMDNVELDFSWDYRKSFEKSSLLISDASSLLVEYLGVNRPVIFTHNGTRGLNSVGSFLCDTVIEAIDSDSLRMAINTSLRSDVLMEKRAQFVSKVMSPIGAVVAKDISNILLKGFR
jgi:hypothetical protein